MQGIAPAELRYGYDTNFRPTAEVVSGDSVGAQYDRDGLLTTVGALTLQGSAALGRLIGTSVGAVTEIFAYDSLGALAADTTSVTGSALYAYRLERDALQRITAKVETVNGTETRFDYAYDSASRLAEVRRDGQLVAGYTYDANGNRLTAVTSSGVVTGTYDAQDRLLSYGGATYGYTAAGELRYKAMGSDTTWYTYDVRGNLRTVVLPTGTRVEHIADALNRRVARKVDGVVTHRFVYTGGLGPAAEVDASGAVVTRFVYGTHVNVPDYFVRGGVTYRVVTDHLGSVRLVVNAATGEPVQRIEYDAYGQVLENTNRGFQPFGYAGGLLDEATGMTRFGARDYDPSSGRWATNDPAGISGGHNLYEYAGDQPVGFADPKGLKPCDCQNGSRSGASVAGRGASGFGGALEYASQFENQTSRAGQAKLGMPSSAWPYWDRTFHLDGPHKGVPDFHFNAEAGPLSGLNHTVVPAWLYRMGSTGALRTMARAALVAGLALDAVNIATASECELNGVIGGVAGGWGGAAGGAALGSLLAPGVGTVIGGILGGMLGGAGGQWIDGSF